MTGEPYQVPASIGQRLLWFLDHYRGGGGSINCPLICRVRGSLDPSRMDAAVGQLVARHESLRTTFRGRGRGLTQVIHPSGSVPVSQVQLRGTDPAEPLRRELLTPLDPDSDPVRATLWRTGDEHLFCLNMHHLVADSWSCGVLFRELGLLLGDGTPGRLPPVDWQYRQFLARQQRLLSGAELARHHEYWRGQLAGVRLPDLPFLTGASQATGERGVIESAVPDHTVRALAHTARSYQTTLFTALLAVYFARLHQVTRQRDLAVASLFANRSRPEVRHTVGFLANMLILRARLPFRPSYADVLLQTRATVTDAFRFQELPYQVLPQTVPRSGHGNVEDVVFQMMPEPIQQATGTDGIELEGVVPDVGGRFDLELALVPHQGGMRAMLYYRKGRFEPGWPADLLSGYTALAEAVAGAPDEPLR